MAKIFVSFVGTGPYYKAKYCWKERSQMIIDVEFAQTAILKFIEEQTKYVSSLSRFIDCWCSSFLCHHSN